jgi:hypothetical protein
MIQLRHELKFHRHVTNRNGIMCPKLGIKIKSNNQYLVWPPAALSTALHLLLMHCTRFASSCCEMLPHSSTKAPACSRTFLGGEGGPSPHPLIQQVPDVLNGIEIRALFWPWQNTDIPVLQEITHRTSSMADCIVMLEGHVRKGTT